VSRSSARTPAPAANGQAGVLFAAEIAGFTGPERDDDIRLYLHEELYRVLHKAYDGPASRGDCFCRAAVAGQDQGRRARRFRGNVPRNCVRGLRRVGWPRLTCGRE